jgi:hypothetical protein
VNDTSGGYHLYDLVFDSVSGTADLFIDGTEAISDYPEHTFETDKDGKRVIWGGGSNPGTGRGHYNLVAWDIADSVGLESTNCSDVKSMYREED